MPKYRKKPVVIEAVQLAVRCRISTREGELTGEIGDWLITGVQGEQYPCGDEIFRETYEPVDDEALAAMEEEVPPWTGTCFPPREEAESVPVDIEATDPCPVCHGAERDDIGQACWRCQREPVPQVGG